MVSQPHRESAGIIVNLSYFLLIDAENFVYITILACLEVLTNNQQLIT